MATKKKKSRRRNPIPDYEAVREKYNNLLDIAFAKQIKLFIKKFDLNLRKSGINASFGKPRAGSPHSSTCSFYIIANRRSRIDIEIKNATITLGYGKREETCETFEKAIDLIKLFWKA